MKTKVIRKENVDAEMIIKKWTPMLEQKGVSSDATHLSELCRYCEYSMIYENSAYIDPPSAQKFKDENEMMEGVNSLLPLSLQVFSKLNLENKNFIACPLPKVNILTNGEKSILDIPNLEIKINMSREVIEEIKASNSNVYDDYIIEKVSGLINNKLKYYDTLIAYQIIQSISIIAEGTKTPAMFVRARVACVDRNTVKPPMYIVKFSDENNIESVEQVFDLSDNFVKATTDDGETYWINRSGDKDEILSDLYSEEEVNRMITNCKDEISILNTNIKALENAFH